MSFIPAGKLGVYIGLPQHVNIGVYVNLAGGSQ